MFMGVQGEKPSAEPPEGSLQLPQLIVNNHILFFDKKASSSGNIKPPMARELLNYYTSDQLRSHFLALGLGIRSVGFRPKPLNPAAGEKEADPVLKEGNLLSNIFNRAVRSCFYTAQKYCDGKIPIGYVSEEVLDKSKITIIEFENAMFRHEFHLAMDIIGKYIRDINKYWSDNMRITEDVFNDNVHRQTLIDSFHMVRVATVLMHPIAPVGTEKILEYLGLGREFWSWDKIFEPIYVFMDNPEKHMLKYLEPRIDFFEKHSSQIQAYK